MSNISVVLIGDGQCSVTHKEPGSSIATSRPPEYGGKGDSFSGTDLLAAALGACMATSLQKVAIREKMPIDQFEINVEKKLSKEPKMVSSLSVQVASKDEICPEQLRNFEAIARSCPVYKSLSENVTITISFI